MADDKIKYSDLISPDDSVEKLIGQLTSLNKLFGDTMDMVKQSASDLRNLLNTTSGATDKGRRVIDDAAQAASRLARAQKELAFAQSDVGKQVAALKSQISETNKESVLADKQARASIDSYNALKTELERLTKEYKALSGQQRMSQNTGGALLDQIAALTARVHELDFALKSKTRTYTELEKAENKLVYLQSEEAKKLQEVKQQIAAVNAEREKENKIAALTAKVNASAEGSYDRLSAQYSLNKIRLNAMSGEMRSATAAGQALEKETANIYAQMVRLQEATGNYRLSVGNYKRAWDGLSMSVSAVVRELPSLAVSANTFFLAISNNLPILADEINNLRAQNARFAADGKPTVSVTKSIVKSLISWNTVLVAGITILSLYGGQILEFISGMVKGRKAVISVSEAMANVSDEVVKSGSNYGQQVTKLKQLREEYLKLRTEGEKTEWIEKMKSEHENLGVAISTVNEADNLYIKQTDAVIASFRARAYAAAAEKIAIEQYNKAFQKRIEAEKKAEGLGAVSLSGEFEASAATKKKMSDENRLARATSGQIASSFSGYGLGGTAISGGFQTTARVNQINTLLEEYKAVEKTADAYFDLATGYNKSAEAALKNAGIRTKDEDDEDEEKRKKGRIPTDLTESLNKKTAELEKKRMESVTRLEEDELEKREKNLRDSAENERNTLMLQYSKNLKILESNEKAKNGVFGMYGKRYKALTDEQVEQVRKQQETISQIILSEADYLKKETERIELEKQKRELEIERETINLKLAEVRKGSEEEAKLRMDLIRNQYGSALVSNRLKSPNARVDEGLITSDYEKKAMLQLGQNDLAEFEHWQKMQEFKFNEVERSEEQITKFTLEQERDRWNYLIMLAEQGSLDWGDKQIEIAKAKVEELNKKISDKSGIKGFIGSIGEKGFAGAILSNLGFDDEALSAFSQATDVIVDNLKSITDAEVQAAEAAVEAQQSRVEAAQSALDAEIEARNNGYANNVATAKKELMEEKKKLQQKQKLAEEAQRRQQAVDTVTQTSSLITASANIWKSMSEVAIIGPALAIAAIAGMWTSFAAAKIKARQATAASEEYGEGGLEFLEGGSHASGNDIDLGTRNKRGKRMRAEGGEALAIINKRRTRKYRSELPNIIDSLNKGTFENTYTRAFASVDEVKGLLVQQSNAADLSRIEEDLSRLRQNSEKQYHTLPDGTVIMYSRNVKRVIRP